MSDKEFWWTLVRLEESLGGPTFIVNIPGWDSSIDLILDVPEKILDAWNKGEWRFWGEVNIGEDEASEVVVKDWNVKITKYCDNKRHLVCLPYSKENLHKSAEELGIKRHWYHGGKKPHYDIPKKMVDDVKDTCIEVSPKDILRIIQGTYRSYVFDL